MATSGEVLRRWQEARRTRCVHLLTKRALCGRPDEGEHENPYPTALWWCGRTGEALGPDEGAAQPGPCDVPGRRCYEAPLGPAE